MKEYNFNTQTPSDKINIHIKCIKVSSESLIEYEYEDKNRFNKLITQMK